MKWELAVVEDTLDGDKLKELLAAGWEPFYLEPHPRYPIRYKVVLKRSGGECGEGCACDCDH